MTQIYTYIIQQSRGFVNILYYIFCAPRGIISIAETPFSAEGGFYMYPFPDPKNEDISSSDSMMNVGSSGDCTGLIPTAVKSDSEEENYNELYDFLPGTTNYHLKDRR